MNILFLSDVSLDIVGGAQESMKVIMQGLKNKYNFKIVTPKNNRKYDFDVIELKEYNNLTLRGKKIIDIIKIIKNLDTIIKTNNINIIHVQMPSTMLLIGIMKAFKLINSNIKIIYTDRGVLNKYKKKTYYGIKVFSTLFLKIVLTTNSNKKLYQDMININKNKLDVIYNTAGEIFEKYEDEKRIVNREKLKFSVKDKVVMFAGRFSKEKNWTLALDIVKELPNDAKVIIALGSNKTPDNILRCKEFIETLEYYVGKENIRSYIDISLNEINNLYYASDIFILTSSTESFGRTAIEAMSRKNVVYGTNIDGLKEVIGFKENLYTTKEEIILKINQIINNEQKLNEEKCKFYDRFNDTFTLEKNLKSYDYLYQNLKGGED